MNRYSGDLYERVSLINGIEPQGKTWTLGSGANPGELNRPFLSAETVREGGLKNRN